METKIYILTDDGWIETNIGLFEFDLLNISTKRTSIIECRCEMNGLFHGIFYHEPWTRFYWKHRNLI